MFGSEPDGNKFDSFPNFRNESFQNQSVTPMMTEEGSYWKIIKEMLNKSKNVNPSKTLSVIKTDLKSLSTECNYVVWFGHSSYLLVLDGKHILVDPVFYKASPLSFFGKPFKTSYEYKPTDFPEIDFLVVTHDHYDHLDYRVACELKPKVKNVITSKGVDEHFKLWGFKEEQMIALNWNDIAIVDGFEFTCLPARHFSGRKFKRSQTLWSSFALKTATANIYLGGDSGYDIHFKEIGQKHGPFDLAILECGQYNNYWPFIHMMPEETLQASIDLRAKSLLPVHWGKFTLATHPWTEPVERLIAANIDETQSILTPQIGEVLGIGSENKTGKWWR